MQEAETDTSPVSRPNKAEPQQFFQSFPAPKTSAAEEKKAVPEPVVAASNVGVIGSSSNNDGKSVERNDKANIESKEDDSDSEDDDDDSSDSDENGKKLKTE
ncbi:MAG: hypothetical protein P4M11_13630 [Candidatus Pacebacteria bacterium]|nr:hypothetical protein [Candidatus Paceibacterota bacterium]